LFESAEGAILLFADGRWVDCNAKALDIFGCTREQIIGEHPIRFSPLTQPDGRPSDEEAVKKIDLAYLTEPQLFEWMHRRADGTSFPAEVSLKRVDLGDKSIIQAIVLDISDRKKAEIFLRESEEKHRLLITQMTQGLALHEVILNEAGNVIDYRFIDVNQAFERLTGLKRAAINGKTVLEVMPKLEQSWIQKYGHVAMTGEPLLFENYSHELGKYFEVVAYSPRPNQFATIISDITDRKKIEKQLQQRTDDLMQSQRIAHIGTWRLDLESNEVIWSEELYKIFGLDPAIPPPNDIGHRKLFTPESYERISSTLEQTSTSGIPYELELETVKFDESKGWIWVRGEAEKDSDGNIIALRGVAHDITEQKQSEIALITLNHNLRRF
jgi:two-component system CheB/CheR fusion protein